MMENYLFFRDNTIKYYLYFRDGKLKGAVPHLNGIFKCVDVDVEGPQVSGEFFVKSYYH